MTMKELWQHRATKMLLALVVAGGVGGVGVALAAGGSGGAAMATHAAPAAPKPAPVPSTTPATTPPPPAPAPAAAAPAANPAPAGAVEVRIVNFKFTPATATIKAGTTVTWMNTDVVGHTVNFHANGINSPSVLNQGDKFSHTFSTPGTYAYICDIHPFMHGTIVVTA
jgi:plastocyanin